LKLTLAARLAGGRRILGGQAQRARLAIYRINIVLFLVLASGASITNCCGFGPLLTCHALFARDGSCRVLFLEPTTGAIGTNSQSGTVFFSFGTKLARIRQIFAYILIFAHFTISTHQRRRRTVLTSATRLARRRRLVVLDLKFTYGTFNTSSGRSREFFSSRTKCTRGTHKCVLFLKLASRTDRTSGGFGGEFFARFTKFTSD
jgi:hypothetical protein